MATNPAVISSRGQGRANDSPTSCAGQFPTDNVSAKRREVYVTMQRQYAEQLKLSDALSARLDVMASQAAVLQNVLVAALEKLGSSKGRPNRAAESEAAAETRYSMRRNLLENNTVRLQEPLQAPCGTIAPSKIMPLLVTAARDTLPTSTPTSKFNLQPCSGNDGLQIGPTASASPVRHLQSATEPDAAAAAACARPCSPLRPTTSGIRDPPQPPATCSGPIESMFTASPAPSLPAPPLLCCSPATVTGCWFAQADSSETLAVPTSNYLGNASSPSGSSEVVACAPQPAADNCEMRGGEGATAFAGMAVKRQRLGPTGLPAPAQGPPPAGDLRAMGQDAGAEARFSTKILSQGSPLPEKVRKVKPADSGRGRSHRSGGGSGGGRRSAKLLLKSQSPPSGASCGGQPTAIAAPSPAAFMAAPTAWHNPLGFCPSYFSNPHVVQVLQLQGALRAEAGSAAAAAGAALMPSSSQLVRQLSRQVSGGAKQLSPPSAQSCFETTLLGIASEVRLPEGLLINRPRGGMASPQGLQALAPPLRSLQPTPQQLFPQLSQPSKPRLSDRALTLSAAGSGSASLGAASVAPGAVTAATAAAAPSAATATAAATAAAAVAAPPPLVAPQAASTAGLGLEGLQLCCMLDDELDAVAEVEGLALWVAAGTARGIGAVCAS